MDLSSINSPLLEEIDLNRLPRHIAVIMDGNGRWAKKNYLPRVQGHWEGVKTVDRIVTLCRKLDVEALTLYSFSEENWNRPPAETSTLMMILDHYLKKELRRMRDENIRFNTIGRIDELPGEIQKRIAHTKEYTRGGDGMTLTLALSYGGRQEILDAVRKVAEKVHAGDYAWRTSIIPYSKVFCIRIRFPISIC